MLLKGIAALSLCAALAFWALHPAFGFPGAAAVFAAGFAALLLAWALSCVICTRFVRMDRPCRKRRPLCRFYADCIIGALMQLFRVRMHVTGLEKLPAEKFLLVGNHRSAWDPVLEMGVFRKCPVGFVAKQELFRIPVVGRLMHACFCFSLDRKSLREGLKTMEAAADVIRSGAASVGIYPEGTRSRGGQLLPFKNGAFKIAQKAGCPVVVVVIRNTECIRRRAPFRRTDVYLDVVGTIGAEAVSAMRSAQLGDAVREMMEQALMGHAEKTAR